jgi:hypothetical protein
MSPSAPKKPSATTSLLVPVLLLLPGLARAAWDMVPEVSLSVDADDNVLLDGTGGEQSASRTALDAAFRLSNFNERGYIYIEPRIVADSYSDTEAKAYETEDTYFTAAGTYRWQTVSVGFRSNYAEQILIDAEFIDVFPEDTDLIPGDGFSDPETGRLLFFDETRKRLNVGGNLDFRLSERNVFRFDLARQDVAYSGAQVSSRSDFDNNSLGMSIIRQVDDRNRVSARFIVSEYNSVRSDNTTDSVGVEGTFTRPIAPTWTMNLTAGVLRSDYDFLASTGLTRIRNASTSPTFAIGFRKRTERTDWNIDTYHRVQPQGNGFLAIRDELRFVVNRQLTQRISAQAGAVYTTTKTVDDVQTADDREYARLQFGIEWALKQTMYLGAGIESTTQEFVNEASDKATSNAIFVSITYRGRSRQNQ